MLYYEKKGVINESQIRIKKKKRKRNDSMNPKIRYILNHLPLYGSCRRIIKKKEFLLDSSFLSCTIDYIFIYKSHCCWPCCASCSLKTCMASSIFSRRASSDSIKWSNSPLSISNNIPVIFPAS